MRNRTACPNCGTEVDGSTLGYGTDEFGERAFGCKVCVMLLSPPPWTSRASVVRAAASVLGTAFAQGRIETRALDSATDLDQLAEDIADLAMMGVVPPGSSSAKNS